MVFVEIGWYQRNWKFLDNRILRNITFLQYDAPFKKMIWDDTLFMLHLFSPCLGLDQFLSYLCDLFLILSLVFIAINYIISLKQTHLFFVHTAQKMKFSIIDFFSKCYQIRRFLRIWSHSLKKSLMENFIFCAVTFLECFLLFLDNNGDEERV